MIYTHVLNLGAGAVRSPQCAASAGVVHGPLHPPLLPPGSLHWRLLSQGSLQPPARPTALIDTAD
jgi:hypothetical protein